MHLAFTVQWTVVLLLAFVDVHTHQGLVGASAFSASPIFRYRTNFFDVLRLKSHLVLGGVQARNVTALAATLANSHSNEESDEHPDDDIGEDIPSLITTTSTTTTKPSWPSSEPSSTEATFSSSSTTTAEQHWTSQRMCGIRSANIIDSLHIPNHFKHSQRQSRIVGGEIVQNGEFPWVVSLLLRGRHYCGAVIIDQQWLLTAAHCVYGHDVASFTALLGSTYSLSSSHSGRGIHGHLSGSNANSNRMSSLTAPVNVTARNAVYHDNGPWHETEDVDDTSEQFDYRTVGHSTLDTESQPNKTENQTTTSNDGTNFKLIKVEKFVVHENFTRTDFFRNDIALVKLKEKVIFNDLISPVCLPISSTTMTDNSLAKPNSPSSFSSSTSSSSWIGGEENEIIQRDEAEHRITSGNEELRKKSRLLDQLMSISSGMSHLSDGTGIVVGWGSMEKHGDNSGASRTFFTKFQRETSQSDDDDEDDGGDERSSSANTSQSTTTTTNNTNAQHKAIDPSVAEDVLRLRKVELPFIDRFTCERWYASRGRPIRLIHAQFCAGLYEGGKDACRGDSGGPMLKRVLTYDQHQKPILEQYQVVGIVSAGIGCALPKLPGIYTKVESYTEWIETNIDQSTTNTGTLDTETDQENDEDFDLGWQRRRRR